MTSYADERRLLQWIDERGGPAATVNVAGRGGEIGLDNDHLPRLVDALETRGLVEVLEDGDVRLTPAGRAFLETTGP